MRLILDNAQPAVNTIYAGTTRRVRGLHVVSIAYWHYSLRPSVQISSNLSDLLPNRPFGRVRTRGVIPPLPPGRKKGFMTFPASPLSKEMESSSLVDPSASTDRTVSDCHMVSPTVRHV